MQDITKSVSTAKVVIVGAGPSGTATALRLSQLGVRDVVLVDAHGFPRDKTCGSGLSPNSIALLKRLGVWERIQPKAYPVDGIRLVTPGEREFVGTAGEAIAAVLLRRYLDHEILLGALDRGVRLLEDFHASEPIESNGRWVGIRARDGRAVMADHVVVANGTHSKLTLDDGPPHLIHAIMGWWDGVPFTPGQVEMLFVPIVSPYYGWLFPESEQRVNIGITYEDDEQPYNAKERFERFLDRYYGDRLAGAKQIGHYKGHAIAYAYTLPKLYSPGRVIIGEAGRMTHPATGEGIYHGMQSGWYAAEALHQIIVEGRSEAWAMRRYQLRCAAKFTGSALAGGLFRQAARTPVLDWVARAAHNEAFVRATTKVLTWI